jgi:hypothetical protein
MNERGQAGGECGTTHTQKAHQLAPSDPSEILHGPSQMADGLVDIPA